ncbi:MAG TPA: SDR family NAD(P)-dependent oxidoreductase [Candidimonas sp.]|nr:SDR family NAD(P)-dependent oxidoreductase [Candidimonas sp.]
MSIRFDGRVAVVTGAGQGLGRSHALELAARGARVVVNDLGGSRDGDGHDSDAAEAVVDQIVRAGGQAMASTANVCNQEEVDEMVKQTIDTWGRVDILVNNAGILRDKSFGKMPEQDFNLVVNVHLLGASNCSRAVWAAMREQKYGRILMTTSTSGIFGNFGQSNYGAAKAGLIGLMNVLHLEGSRYGIKVNALAPTAGTRMTEELFQKEALDELQPEFVTPAAIFLVSDDAPSRMILLAGAGTYAKVAIVETPGIYLDKGSRTAENIACNFDAISRMDGAVETLEGYAHIERILKRARQEASSPGALG